jgi:choline dehydrogenase-like flavoprotein
VKLPKRIESADAVVVGSGAGGAVIAFELARHGVRVTVLEEGPHIPSSRFTQRDEEMVGLLYRLGGMQATEDMGVAVLQGCCVGGSTVINMGDITFTPPQVWQYWRDVYDLQGITYGEFLKASLLPRKMVRAGPIQEHEINENNRLLLEYGKKKGIRAGVFEDNREGCVGSGYCLLGCSYDAKKSTLITYIPEAVKRGARILSLHRVERVVVEKDRVRWVEASQLNPKGEVLGPVEIRTPYVFLCAGAIHTPLILLRSRIKNRHIGSHLSLQPQAPLVAQFPRRMISYRGIPQSVYVDEYEEYDEKRGFSGFRIEGIFATPGQGAQFMPGIGKAILSLMSRYDSLGGVLVLVPDSPSGEVVPTKDGYRILYRLSGDVEERLKKGVMKAVEIFLEMGAEKVYLPVDYLPPVDRNTDLSFIRSHLTFKPGYARLVSAHPQGTCRMSDNPKKGVVNSRFQVYGIEGVYVADASIFPTTSSSHTMLPIMTMAHLCARKFLEDHGIPYKEEID